MLCVLVWRAGEGRASTAAAAPPPCKGFVNALLFLGNITRKMKLREGVIKVGDSLRKETLVPLFFTFYIFLPLCSPALPSPSALIPPSASLLVSFPSVPPTVGRRPREGFGGDRASEKHLIISIFRGLSACCREFSSNSDQIPASASPRRDKASDVPIRPDSPKLQCPIQFQRPQAPPHLNNCGGGAEAPRAGQTLCLISDNKCCLALWPRFSQTALKLNDSVIPLICWR